MVEETNHLAKQYCESHGNDIQSGNLTFDWTAVDVNEMKKLAGLLLLIGIHYLPEINLYWSTEELYNAPVYDESMRKDRFKQILRFWHFNNNENYDPNDPDRDRLYKPCRLIDVYVQTVGRCLNQERMSVLTSHYCFSRVDCIFNNIFGQRGQG